MLYNLTYFNYAGLAPKNISRKQQEAENEFQRLLFSEKGVKKYFMLLQDCRAEVAKLLNARNHDVISLLPNASFGLNIAINALQVKPGHIIITSDQEHPASKMPLGNLRQKGVKINCISATTATEIEGKIEEQVKKEPVALILISHVSYKDGRIFPVENIGKIAKRYRVPYIVDGAQAVGHINVDVNSIHPSVYVFSGHKWLFGPMGTGGMLVEKDFAEKYGGAWDGWTSKPETIHKRRFEAGTINFGLIAGLLEAIHDALSSREQRYHDLCTLQSKIINRLSHLTSWTLAKWDGEHAPGILTYRLPEVINPWEFTDHLFRDYNIVIKPFDPLEFDPQKKTNAVRISFSPSTSEEEIDKLVNGLEEEIYNCSYIGVENEQILNVGI